MRLNRKSGGGADRDRTGLAGFSLIRGCLQGKWVFVAAGRAAHWQMSSQIQGFVGGFPAGWNREPFSEIRE